MSDLISRSALIKRIRDYADEVGCVRGEYELANGILKAISVVEDAPTVEAKPVVHGYWIENTAGYYVCSNCRQLAKGDMTGCFKDRKFRQERTDFCPNCGADMRGEKHD